MRALATLCSRLADGFCFIRSHGHEVDGKHLKHSDDSVVLFG